MTVSPEIASSAIVSPAAELGEGVYIGPFVVVEDDVKVGRGSVVLAGTILHSGTRVGSGCRLGPYAVIAGEPMDTAFRGEPSLAVIGDRVTLREYVTVNRATGEGEQTRVGDDTLVMSYAHVSHNTEVGRSCVLTTAVQLGGHSCVGDRAVLGSQVLLHQHARVGTYAILGAASGTNRDILPFTMASGKPARHLRLNRVGLRRNGIDGERYRALERAIRALRWRDLETVSELAETFEDVALLSEFIQSSSRGVARFAGRSVGVGWA